MNNKQQGFEDNDTGFYQFIVHDQFSKINCPIKPLQSKNKLKLNFKSPLTIFNNQKITMAPDDNLQIIWNQQQNSLTNYTKIQSNHKAIYVQPLESIIIKFDKTIQLFGSVEGNKTILQKVADIFPKKDLCAYNRFHQNVFLKSDLTIVVKNISKCIKFQLLKSIQNQFPFDKLKQSHLVQKTEKQIVQKQKKFEKRPKRYQSQHTFRTNEQNKIFSKRIDYSPFQIQKSMILSKQVKHRICDIQFFSNFQSGNLHLAFRDKLVDNLFYLFLTNDTNTHGFNQWFYFGIKYTGKQNKKYRFIIMNISKQFKYTEQMRILTLVNQKWSRNTPFQIYKNKYSRYNGGNLISLDFQYEFNNKLGHQEPVFFSLLYPYTYSRLLRFLKQIKNNVYKSLFVTVQALGKSQLMNHIPVVKIQKVQYKKIKQGQQLKSNYILILARQHASETPSSFICESLIRNILNQESQWSVILNNYKFVIIPMVNPDGVIHGNSRTNIKGYDINRLWQTSRSNNGSSQFMSIQTQQINNYLNQLLKNGQIEYTIDLHSHSKQYGSFVYCNDNSQGSRLFRYYFTQKYGQCIYDKCKINLTSDKKCTFRGQMYYRLGIKNSFTIQTSYYGYMNDINKDTNNSLIEDKQMKLIAFTALNYENIAKSILYGLRQVSIKLRQKLQVSKQVFQIIQQLDIKIKSLNRINMLKNNKQDNNESDSDPQNQYLQIKQRQQNGQTIIKSNQINKSNTNIFINNNNKPKSSLILKNKQSYQITKIQSSFNKQYHKSRKKIYSHLGNINKSTIYPTSNEQYLQLSDNNKRCNKLESNNLQVKQFVNKQRQKCIDFRKTLRRGYKMAQSQTGFYNNRSKSTNNHKSKKQYKQPANFIVYPTQTDLHIQQSNIRILHENLFKGRIKVKSIKQQQYKFSNNNKNYVINNNNNNNYNVSSNNIISNNNKKSQNNNQIQQNNDNYNNSDIINNKDAINNKDKINICNNSVYGSSISNLIINNNNRNNYNKKNNLNNNQMNNSINMLKNTLNRQIFNNELIKQKEQHKTNYNKYTNINKQIQKQKQSYLYQQYDQHKQKLLQKSNQQRKSFNKSLKSLNKSFNSENKYQNLIPFKQQNTYPQDVNMNKSGDNNKQFEYLQQYKQQNMFLKIQRIQYIKRCDQRN